jgi:hypothetical protein
LCGAATALLLIQLLLAWLWLQANAIGTAGRSRAWHLPLLAALLQHWLLVA